MTRDETVVLFERCEQARKTALTEGKNQGEAQEAAKAIWNAWAVAKLTERNKLVEAGEWVVIPEQRRSDWQVGKNDKTKKWLSAASSDFQGIFLTRA